jgi:hypothetical protein
MNPDFEPLWPEGLSDESACALSEWLQQLALACESHYFAQLRRYRDARQIELLDPEQPWRKRPVDD